MNRVDREPGIRTDYDQFLAIQDQYWNLSEMLSHYFPLMIDRFVTSGDGSFDLLATIDTLTRAGNKLNELSSNDMPCDGRHIDLVRTWAV